MRINGFVIKKSHKKIVWVQIKPVPQPGFLVPQSWIDEFHRVTVSRETAEAKPLSTVSYHEAFNLFITQGVQALTEAQKSALKL